MSDIAKAIEIEPGLSLQVLKVANSAWYQREGKIDTVLEAINNLGIYNVYQIVISTTVCRVFQKIDSDLIDMTTFWKQSVQMACATRTLAGVIKHTRQEALFTAGLLAYTGRLVLLLSQPEKTAECILQSKKTATPLCLIEQEQLGFDHSDISYHLLKAWKLPESLYLPARYYCKPDQSPETIRKDTSLLYLGHYMQYTYWTGLRMTDPPGILNHQATLITTINEAKLPELARQAHELYEQAMSIYEF